MNWFNQGRPLMLFDGTGGAGGAGDGGGAVTVPWAQAPAGQPWTIGDKPWHQHIPEAPVAELMAAKQYRTPAEVATAYFNINKLMSSDKRVTLPGENASQEEVAAYNKAWGVPDNADAYDFKFPAEFKADEGTMKFGKSLAHKLGLNPKQAQIMAAEWNTFATETAKNNPGLQTEQQRTQAQTDANNTAITKLVEKWGSTGELEANKQAGLRTMKGLGYTEVEMAALETKVGLAEVADLFARIGKATSEGSFKGGGGGNGDPNDPANMTADQARMKVDALQNDTAFMTKYSNKMDPNHREAVQLMERLYAKMG